MTEPQAHTAREAWEVAGMPSYELTFTMGWEAKARSQATELEDARAEAVRDVMAYLHPSISTMQVDALIARVNKANRVQETSPDDGWALTAHFAELMASQLFDLRTQSRDQASITLDSAGIEGIQRMLEGTIRGDLNFVRTRMPQLTHAVSRALKPHE